MINLRRSKEEERILQKLNESNMKIDELEELNDKKNKDILDLKKHIVELQTAIVTSDSDDDLIKKILILYAKNNSYLEIFDKIKLQGYRDIELIYIKEICTNRKNLKSEFVLYFKEQQEAYIKSISMKPDVHIDKNLLRLERLYNEAELDLAKCETLDEKKKIREELRNLIKESNGTIKNIIDDKTDIVQNEALSKIANGLTKALSENMDIEDEFEMESFEVM